jgi:hypothetical protein
MCALARRPGGVRQSNTRGPPRRASPTGIRRAGGVKAVVAALTLDCLRAHLAVSFLGFFPHWVAPIPCDVCRRLNQKSPHFQISLSLGGQILAGGSFSMSSPVSSPKMKHLS